MAKPSDFQQRFQVNVTKSSEISRDMDRCNLGIADMVARSKAIIAESRELIARIDRELARQAASVALPP